MGAALLIALLAVAVSGGPVAPPATPGPELDDDFCYTDGCNRTVSSLALSINTSVDPCQDFFQYACGGFVQDTEIPPGMTTVSIISQMGQRLREQLQGLLAAPESASDPASFNKAKRLYGSCVNTERLEELGVQPALRILEAVGGWPMLLAGSWDEDKFDWLSTLYAFEDIGIDSGNFLFSFGIKIDVPNTTRHIIQIDPPAFNLDVKALDIATQLRRIQENSRKMEKSAVLLAGTDENAGSIKLEAHLASMLEVSLNQGTKSLEDKHNLLLNINRMNVSSLQTEFPFVRWMEYLGRMLPAGAGASLTDAEVVMVSDLGYLRSLGAELAKVPKRTLANYMVWRALEAGVLPLLNEKACTILEQTSGNRASDCVHLVQTNMRMATAAMYVRNFSSVEVRSKVREMVQDIGKEMLHLLESVEWMDPATRQQAVLKAGAMHHHVGFPDELLNDTLLDDYYSGVEVLADRLLDNTLALDKESRRREANKFRTPAKKREWTGVTGYADIVNAFYLHSENSLSIPAGILQGAFFQNDRPQYMNYGGIGFAIGHEVSHGFDETGGLFNIHGLMENWWEEETKKRFDEKVKCIVDMYSTLRSDEVNATVASVTLSASLTTQVNGVITQSENIADNAALKLAYRAYRRYTARRGPEQGVVIPVVERMGEEPGAGPPGDTASHSPHVSLKPRQMFWVSFASLWCDKHKERELYRTLRLSDHLPGVHRVNGALRNQEAFAEDFNCPKGTPMNPEHKCEVW
ncbi:Neprilysin-2 [Frankliniella fusca]|uniref:Neprilysin-2 n=1 Tax=Frankliniella fusca TaxID=407009 RepID=A0AAE1I5K8_9NEOP|nr:Neprilysin-2 [Frankliniella fusca]